MNKTGSCSYDAVLFDLDGTLLRVQMTEFIPRYVDGLAESCRAYAKPKKFVRVMLDSIRELLKTNGDGEQTNEQRVYSFVQQRLGIPEAVLRETFQNFADNHLDSLKALIHPIPLAKKILQECLEQEIPLVLATNPVFPEFMIQARLRWAGLDDIPFVHLSSFENSCYCKPQSGYFREILAQLQLAPERCLMVGNDADQDMSAAAVGMQTFLVDTWLIEREGANWPYDSRGDHGALQRFLHERFSRSCWVRSRSPQEGKD